MQRSKIEPCYAPFGGYGEEGGRSSQAWVSEAKERMVEVTATEPQGCLRGVMVSRKFI